MHCPSHRSNSPTPQVAKCHSCRRRGNSTTYGSTEPSLSWAGQEAATCGSNFAEAPLTGIELRRWQRSLSICGPTRSLVTPRSRPAPVRQSDRHVHVVATLRYLVDESVERDQDLLDSGLGVVQVIHGGLLTPRSTGCVGLVCRFGFKDDGQRQRYPRPHRPCHDEGLVEGEAAEAKGVERVDDHRRGP